MFLDKIKASPAEGEFNVIIEIPMDSPPVKYEFDKDSGAIFVDRFIPTAMFYPCNYGFVPHTLSGDGDPADVLVLGRYPLVPASVIRVRPVAVLIMEDESGFDEKILAVPSLKLDPSFAHVKDLEDLEQILKDRIAHFFENYKKLEKDKWVKIVGWEGSGKAKNLLKEAIDRASRG